MKCEQCKFRWVYVGMDWQPARETALMCGNPDAPVKNGVPLSRDFGCELAEKWEEPPTEPPRSVHFLFGNVQDLQNKLAREITELGREIRRISP